MNSYGNQRDFLRRLVAVRVLISLSIIRIVFFFWSVPSCRISFTCTRKDWLPCSLEKMISSRFSLASSFSRENELRVDLVIRTMTY